MACTKKHESKKKADKSAPGNLDQTIGQRIAAKLAAAFPDDWRLNGRFQAPGPPTSTSAGHRPAFAR